MCVGCFGQGIAVPWPQPTKLKGIRAASAEQLAEAKGIGPALAAAIVAHFSSDAETAELVPAVNMTTGEILET